MIKNIEAFAADIDMTLTAKGGALPEIVKEALTELHRRNIPLGLATGREIVDKLKHIGTVDWGLDFEFDFIIGMNGGMIYDTKTDSLWSMDLMSREDMKEILTYMKPLIDKYSISVNAEGGGNHNAMNIHNELMESMRRHGWVFIDKTDDIDGFCELPAYKMLFRTDPAYDKEIRETFLSRFGDNWQIIGTFPGTLEIMQKGIDKGSGMARYAKEHNINMENVIAFGDNENDNSLLIDCGWGVCLANGSDGTKAVADDITEYPCDQGGVGRYLFEHCL